MKFELLREEDVKGKNCLSIFKKISPVAFSTDILSNGSKKEYSYWLNSYRNYPTEKLQWQLEQYSHIEAKYMNELGIVKSSRLDNKQIGVRLKVPFDDIKSEIILSDLHGDMYVSEVENDVKVLLALEWPQEFVETSKDKDNLDILYKYGKLIQTDRYFSVSVDEVVNAIYYKQAKYVRINDSWAKVSPIEWYYDEEANVLVSKKIFLCYPMANFSGKHKSSFDIEESIIYSFLNSVFIKQATMNSTEKDFMYTFPFALYYYPYTDELKELYFWKLYYEKREERRLALRSIQTEFLAMERDDICKMIDDILRLNEEDENLVEEYLSIKKN